MAFDHLPEKILSKLDSGKALTVIGMMSGTSMDGIDVALIESDGKDFVKTLKAEEYPYKADFKVQIAKGLEEAIGLSSAKDRTPFLKDLETAITDLHAKAFHAFLTTHDLSPEDIDLIGFHGQTVLHRPQSGYTVQLGNGQQLANETKIAVIYDMRSNDMAHGGQGAPLVPVFHQAFSGNLPQEFQNRLPVVFVNIGGISNISFIGSDGELIAFDTGPGNALIDQWVQSEAGIPFDQNGAIASEGGLIVSIVERYLAESFFEQTIPKSLDRNDFKPLAPGAASLEDGARTLAHISAAAILKSCDHLPQTPMLWIICGGGRKNPAIMADLKSLAAEIGSRAILAEEAGLDGDSMEAEAWAYLAVRSVKGLPLTFPKTTGCKEPVTGGRLALPET
ncbi:MAG: anhydro-N-acetylmuramic acid kinase [Salaquimonas sp.]